MKNAIEHLLLRKYKDDDRFDISLFSVDCEDGNYVISFRTYRTFGVSISKEDAKNLAVLVLVFQEFDKLVEKAYL